MRDVWTSKVVALDLPCAHKYIVGYIFAHCTLCISRHEDVRVICYGYVHMHDSSFDYLYWAVGLLHVVQHPTLCIEACGLSKSYKELFHGA